MTSLQELEEWMPTLKVFCLDDGGVLNDNRLRAPEWRRIIGEFMPPRLGGTSQQWAEANREVFLPLWADLHGQPSRSEGVFIAPDTTSLLDNVSVQQVAINDVPISKRAPIATLVQHIVFRRFS